MPRVGLIGYGYWGPNLLRNFLLNGAFEVAAVADSRAARREAAASMRGVSFRTTEEAEDLIRDPTIDAIAIATPTASHFDLAMRALRAGKHVFVEKPLCETLEQARELQALGRRQGLVVMTDHVYLVSPPVRKIKQLVASGVLGEISYIDCARVNLGLFQPDVSVLWDLGVHDFSIADWLLDAVPLHIEATGHCHVKPGNPDMVFVTMHFPKMIAHFNLSWMSPVKLRRMAIGGSKQMLVWDDLSLDETIKIYDSGIELRSEDTRRDSLPGYRIGDVHSPRLSAAEPLSIVVDEFARAIAGETTSPLHIDRAMRVVSLLEASERALNRSLSEVSRLTPAAGLDAVVG